MKIDRRRTVSVILSAMASLALAGPAQAQQALKIGVVASLTGGAAYIGEDIRNTAELLRDAVNASGGINGRKIETVVYDDASDPTKAVTAIRRLHDQDNVLVVLGPAISGNALATIPQTEAAKVPQIMLGASAKISNPVKHYVFQACNTDIQSVALALDFLKKRGITEVAMFADSTGYGVSGKEELERQAGPKGFKIVASETFAPNDTDMTAQLTRIKASGAKAFIVWNATTASALVAKNAKQIGLNALQIHSTAFQSDRLIGLAGDAAENVFVTGYKASVVGELPDSDPQKKIIREYFDTFNKRYGKNPSVFGALTKDGFSMVVKAFTDGATDREKIRTSLESLKDHMGAGGIYTTSPTDHNGFLVQSMRMLTIKQGKFALAPNQ